MLTPRPLLVSPLWLGNVLLTAVLLLVRRRTWPAFLVAGLAGFVFYDVQAGASIRSVVSFLLSNAVEVLIAAWCLSSSFDGVPRLNSLRALAKYSFYVVFLAPFVGAFLGALANGSLYWPSWKVAFLSEAIGFLALMPAILGWVRGIHTWAEKRRGYYAEAAALVVALGVLGYLVFDTPEKSIFPALLYSLVPLLLWATLRFGSTGVSSSVIAIAFVSIWGAVHGRGPFTGPGPVIQVLSLQLFLFFTAAPFMVLAAVVEESKDAERTLRQRDRDLNEAQRLAKTGSWQWDPDSDAVTWSAELYRLAGYDPGLPPPSFKDHEQFFTLESWGRLKEGMEKALLTGASYQLDLEGKRPHGGRRCLTYRGEPVIDGSGRPIYVRGTTQDITDRKLSEEAIVALSGRLITAQEEERSRIARELHDDLSQRMALLHISLERMSSVLVFLFSPRDLAKMTEMTTEMSSDIDNWSHQLHPSKLELLGLVRSLQALCREFTVQHKIEFRFLHRDVPGKLPKDVTLYLYRITQEALRNVVRHSEAAEAEVKLSGGVDEISFPFPTRVRVLMLNRQRRDQG